METPCEEKCLFSSQRKPLLPERGTIVMRRTVAQALFVVIILVAGEGQGARVLAQAHNHGSHDESPHAQEGGRSDPAAVQVQITIRSGGFELRTGGQPVGDVALTAGRSAVFALRNDDSIPHEFISALFTRIELHFTGRATGIFRKDAAGFRLKPGESLTIQFMAPFSDFRTMYDLIWCSHHREHVIVVTEDRQPGS